MKMQRLYITALMVGVVTLLLVMVVPHHHHNGIMCTIVECCQSDHEENDTHTAHHDDGTTCFELAKCSIGGVKMVKYDKSEEIGASLWGIMIAIGLWAGQGLSASKVKAYVCQCIGHVCRCHTYCFGLRAPPQYC